MPHMKLQTMQDIGGCRAVLSSVTECRRVLARIEKTGRIKDLSDYITHPRASGYRAIHAVVTYSDGFTDRKIEMQLRTVLQHDWAVAVERLGGRIGFDLKSGQGPPEILAFFEVTGRAIAYEEAGKVPAAVQKEYAAARRQIAHIIGP